MLKCAGRYFYTADWCNGSIPVSLTGGSGSIPQSASKKGEAMANDVLLEGSIEEKPRNTLAVRDDWGICPKCGKRCIRLLQDTILVRFPMYCKACKKEYMVNWKPEK